MNAIERFPEILKWARASLGYKQEDLADALGVTRKTVNRWEAGEFYPSFDTFLYLCHILAVSPNDMVGWTKERGFL